MKPRKLLAATCVIGALAGATPAHAGPLGIVSGGAGAIGTLGGTLQGFGSNPALGVGSMIGATGQFQGAVTPPDLVIDRAPIRSAIGTVHTVGGRAQGRVEGATEAALRTSAAAAGEAASAVSAASEASRIPSLGADVSAAAAGEASAGPASAQGGGGAQAQAQFGR